MLTPVARILYGHVKTEGEILKTKNQYADEAIQLAIAGRWDEAVALNREILEKFGADEDANNRLGKALTELGKLEDAKKAYSATLAQNQFNVIARKNVLKLESLLQAKANLKGGPVKVDLNLFVEEMGKTVMTQLEDSAENVCDKVVAGDVAELRVEGDGIVAETVRGVRLGVLEAKLARRLIKFIQGGNRYQAGVTACDPGVVRVIIRETYQDAKFAGKPSFPMKRQRTTEFRPYAKESLIPRGRADYGDDDEDQDSGPDRGEEEYEGMSVDDDEGPEADFSDDSGEDLGEIEEESSDDEDEDEE